jgi:hypothetical protein
MEHASVSNADKPSGLLCSVSHILHATGEGERTEQVLHGYDATGSFASNSSSNVAQLYL